MDLVDSRVDARLLKQSDTPRLIPLVRFLRNHLFLPATIAPRGEFAPSILREVLLPVVCCRL